MKLSHWCSAVVLAVGLGLSASGVTAQETPVFKNYDDMRAQLDELMMSRQIAAVMNRFGGSSDLSAEQVEQLEARMRDMFPIDFKHVDVMRVDEMGGGWSQELYAYWTGLNYVFVTVLLHQREDNLVALNIKFNTDFYKLIGSF
ncbi:hypothetical protein EI983_09865 [Roseovarius faecimaris]|uniref:DUF3887 domain-containing protein n=1 Tax=Roseovarius faecimaris TaxID=2494550 RepID=A0A6I6ITB5_9RHOB|nr:hypothetical protein [Roseovarius faecimaris]QGX98566.1 hypothetical protein EI983_09865 [Roseovarius faecimaris]